MIQFIQNFFLSPFLVFLMLLAVFAGLSWWAVKRRKEYVGYGLGWLIGVFFMVIYGALFGEPEPVAQTAEIVPETLSLFQVMVPSLIGIVMGIVAMLLINQTYRQSSRKSFVVPVLTAMSLSVLFLMIISSAYPVTQRMIGLFALAFAIGALTMLAYYRQTPPTMQASNVPQSPISDVGRGNVPSVPVSNEDDQSFRERIRRR